jgi:hypothetical protein
MPVRKKLFHCFSKKKLLLCLILKKGNTVLSWIETQADIAALARRQLFFVGGAPRSGTTWLQQLLDSHPDVSCKGEGLFMKHLAEPMAAMMAERTRVLQGKNTTLFTHTGGYPLAERPDVEFLVGSAILLALRRQCHTPCRAMGEKTPENVFFFPYLRRLFPAAKFIAIARDPRDVIASAWHFFQAKHTPKAGDKEKIAFINLAMPSMVEGMRCMLDFSDRHPEDCAIVTYESLLRKPAPVLARLYRLIGVSDDRAIVAEALRRTEFTAVTGGRAPGTAQEGAFLRKGVAGDWRNTLTPQMGDMIVNLMAWSFGRLDMAEPERAALAEA